MSRISHSPLQITEEKCRKREQPRWVAPQGPYDRGRMSTTYREFNAKPRLYIFVEGENILENLAYRFDRPSHLYRTILPAAFELLGIPATAKASWSQKAGCSCGCSPGFILTDWVGDDGDSYPRDFYVTVTAADVDEAKFVATDDSIARADDRLRQLEAQGVFDAMRTAAQSARSPEGRIRNLRAMTEDKFMAVAKAVAAEDNDLEAQAAVKEEAYRRFTVV